MKTIMTNVLPVVQVVSSPQITTIRERPCVHSTSLSPTPQKRSISVDDSNDVVIESNDVETASSETFN